MVDKICPLDTAMDDIRGHGISSAGYNRYMGDDVCFNVGWMRSSFRKEAKGYVHFFGAKKRNQRSIHLSQALPYMEGM